MSAKKYLHFLICLDIQTSEGNTKQTENRFLLPSYPMKQNVALFSGAMYSFYALIKLFVSIMGYRWINEY